MQRPSTTLEGLERGSRSLHNCGHESPLRRGAATVLYNQYIATIVFCIPYPPIICSINCAWPSVMIVRLTVMPLVHDDIPIQRPASTRIDIPFLKRRVQMQFPWGVRSPPAALDASCSGILRSGHLLRQRTAPNGPRRGSTIGADRAV